MPVGNLSSPMYFDFIAFSQYATISKAIPDAPQVFEVRKAKSIIDITCCYALNVVLSALLQAFEVHPFCKVLTCVKRPVRTDVYPCHRCKPPCKLLLQQHNAKLSLIKPCCAGVL